MTPTDDSDRRLRHRPLGPSRAIPGDRVVTTTWVGSQHYALFMTDFIADVTSVSLLQGRMVQLHDSGDSRDPRDGSLSGVPLLSASTPRSRTSCLRRPSSSPAPSARSSVFHQRIPSKRMLFDIGAAGPIAGFAVAVPALFMGLRLSHVVPLPDDFVGLSLGEPLLFQGVAWLVWGAPPDGYTLNLHPVALAAWFGLLVTAFNLFPIAQLDGGHISYATLGRWSTTVTRAATAVVVGLAVLVSISWSVWALLMIVMVFAFGAEHPPTDDAHVPLDRTRQWIAVGTAVMFIVCFTPAPIEVMDLIVTPE